MSCWWNRTSQKHHLCIWECCWIVRFPQRPINVDKMSQPIFVTGRPIRGTVQRRFGPSCVLQVYFICKFTEFHGMRMECKIINNSRSFITVPLIIVNRQQFLDCSLPNRSLIASQSLPSLINICYRTSSLPQRLQTWTILKRYYLLILLSIHWMKLITEDPSV